MMQFIRVMAWITVMLTLYDLRANGQENLVPVVSTMGDQESSKSIGSLFRMMRRQPKMLWLYDTVVP